MQEGCNDRSRIATKDSDVGVTRVAPKVPMDDVLAIWLPVVLGGSIESYIQNLSSVRNPHCNCPFPKITVVTEPLFLHGYRIFFPKAESASSTARSAVRLCSSMTGFTSTISNEVIRPWSAMASITRWASR